MAEKIIEGGGDYWLALKGNQGSLLSDARSCLSKAEEALPSAETTDRAHNRIETRRAVVVGADGLGDYHEFPGLQAFGRIESIREIDGKCKSGIRIYVLSRILSPAELLRVARAH
jgi:hypothetical protein